MESQKARAKRLKDYYNLTIEQWDAIFYFQSGLCWLCGCTERTGKRLATDHSHLDGLVRGLLCSRCNPLLGKWENSFVRLGLHKVPGLTLPILALRVAEYLARPPATQALGQLVHGYAGRTGTKTHRKFIKRQKKATTPSEQPRTPRKREIIRP